MYAIKTGQQRTHLPEYPIKINLSRVRKKTKTERRYKKEEDKRERMVEERRDSISFHFGSTERIGARYKDASRRENLARKHFEESQTRLSYG